MKLLKIQEGRLWEGSIRETFFMWIHSKRDAPGGGGRGGSEQGVNREFTAVGQDC